MPRGPKPGDKLAVPLILFAFARGPLDRDGGRDTLRKDALASNSLGLIGFLVGTVAQPHNIAAGIGYYGTALSVYERIFARGKEVVFARDTRILLQVTARRSSPIKATNAAAKQPSPTPTRSCREVCW